MFADSLGYATAPLRGEIPGFFSIFYSILILPLHQGVTLWPVVFVQAAMLAHLLYLTTRSVSDGAISKAETLLIIGVLCIFSGAPWITGQIMPDVFSSVLLLTIFLIAFCTDQLRRGEVLYVSVLMTVAIATHFSPCADCLWFDSVVVRIEAHFWAEQGSHLASAALLLMPFVVAVCSMLGVNWADSRGIGFARNSNVFLLAKWIDEGPALAYLTRACPTTGNELAPPVTIIGGYPGAEPSIAVSQFGRRAWSWRSRESTWPIIPPGMRDQLG